MVFSIFVNALLDCVIELLWLYRGAHACYKYLWGLSWLFVGGCCIFRNVYWIPMIVSFDDNVQHLQAWYTKGSEVCIKIRTSHWGLSVFISITLYIVFLISFYLIIGTILKFTLFIIKMNDWVMIMGQTNFSSRCFFFVSVLGRCFVNMRCLYICIWCGEDENCVHESISQLFY